MNRIVVGNDINGVGILKDDILTLEINEDAYLFINDDKKFKYNINVNKGILNVMCVLENNYGFDVEINVFGGKVLFNSISYNGNDEHFRINLNENNASCYGYNSVISRTPNNVKIEVTHNCSNTISSVYNCGATKELGSIKFDVVSKVPRGSKRCLVNQDSKIITFNDENKNEINPVLLVDEYETEAKHAAFIGKFNDDQMFYLKSRGIKEKDAMALLLKGFLVGIMNVSDDEKEMLKEKINDDWR